MRGNIDTRDQTRPEQLRAVLEAGSGRPLVPTVVRWPLEVDESFSGMFLRDPWQSMVRDSIVAYREGRADVASWSWTNDVVWRVSANGFSEEHRGPDRIFAYHQRLVRASGGTFRQWLKALQASNGPIVEAYVDSTARRGRRELNVSGLIVFELTGGRIRTVTELPGDPEAWGRFWAD